MFEHSFKQSSQEPVGRSDAFGAINKSTRASISIVRESQTALGTVELRRRASLALERDVFEILLNGKLMMSSAVHISENELADRALAELRQDEIHVLVGGLGLGFTALRALDDQRVKSVIVVEFLAPIIEWHREGLFPWADSLLNNPRVELVQDDFYSFLARSGASRSLFDAILIDIDDAPSVVWHPAHADFYTHQGLGTALNRLVPGGVLAIWCAVRPGDAFLSKMGAALTDARLERVEYVNPCLRETEEHFVILGRVTVHALG